MRGGWSTRVLALALCAAWGFAAPASAQITTGAVTGTVTDAQGGVIPGATVVLISETQGTKLAPVVTNARRAVHVIPNVTADTYTVEVTMSGFRTLTARGVKVSGGDRVAGRNARPAGRRRDRERHGHGRIAGPPGRDRRAIVGALSAVQLENLPIATHNFLDFITTQIGIDRHARRTRTASASAAAARTTS